jgi:hypothetical protein
MSDLEDKFTCTECGRRGADVRPDFNWDKKSVGFYPDLKAQKLAADQSAFGKSSSSCVLVLWEVSP